MELVHQQCLKRWIKHSGRQKCQVCLYRYRYTYQTQSWEEIAQRLRKRSAAVPEDNKVTVYWRFINLITWGVLSYLYWHYMESLILIDLNSTTTSGQQGGSVKNNSQAETCVTYTSSHKNLSFVGYNKRVHATYKACV